MVGNTNRKPIWPNAKSLKKRDGPKISTAICGPLGFIYYPLGKAKQLLNA